jgi:phosphohistidine phosphatase
MSDARRWLVLLRHAKAQAGAPDLLDHARPLTAGGRATAQRMGAYLAAHVRAPQLVLCSSSQRTRDTCEALRGFLSPGARVAVEDALYLAGHDALLARVCEAPDPDAVLLLIGHNPGIQQLAVAFALEGDAALRRRLASNFPPAACAVLSAPGPHWRDLVNGCRLEAFVRPEDVDA